MATNIFENAKQQVGQLSKETWQCFMERMARSYAEDVKLFLLDGEVSKEFSMAIILLVDLLKNKKENFTEEDKNIFSNAKKQVDGINDKTWSIFMKRMSTSYSDDVQEYLENKENPIELSMALVITIDSVINGMEKKQRKSQEPTPELSSN